MCIGVCVRIFLELQFSSYLIRKKNVFILENLCVLIPQSDCVVIRGCEPTKKGNMWNETGEVVSPAEH